MLIRREFLYWLLNSFVAELRAMLYFVLACMTKSGDQCLFPFRYGNETHPELTYKICSSLDVYRPWCATKLDATLKVVEWGDCLPDCPSEIVNSVCQEESDFPAFADGTDKSVNYTSNYDRGSGIVTDEVCSKMPVIWDGRYICTLYTYVCFAFSLIM